MYKKCVLAVLIVFVACFVVYNPERHAKHYSFVHDSDVLSELVPDNSVVKNSNLKSCPYDSIVNNEEFDIDDVYKVQRFLTPMKGGEYIPEKCKPSYKTAIIVPYRDRKEQLKLFLNYMHPFLQRQNIQYRIFIVEQNNTLPFNRAKLLNYGSLEAMRLGYKCLILHDVDIMPLSTGNIYACSKRPRHMCSCLDIFRFNLPYEGLFGGVISILSENFTAINGMSNMYEGWGGEDDDLYTRLSSLNIIPYRFSPKLSKYMMLFHKKERPSETRYQRLQNSLKRQKTDGLNALNTNYIVNLEPLFTHVITR